MPKQVYSVPGQIKIMAQGADETAAFSKRRQAEELLGQIVLALNRLENQWGEMTTEERMEVLRQAEICELNASRFVLEEIVPKNRLHLS
jgi:hypothetical protein